MKEKEKKKARKKIYIGKNEIVGFSDNAMKADKMENWNNGVQGRWRE